MFPSSTLENFPQQNLVNGIRDVQLGGKYDVSYGISGGNFCVAQTWIDVTDRIWVDLYKSTDSIRDNLDQKLKIKAVCRLKKFGSEAL